MRAAILDRQQLARAVVDPDRCPAQLDELDRPRPELVQRRDVDLGIVLVELELVGEALPLRRERRPLRAVERDLQDAEAENRALQADRRQRDADLLEQLLLRQRRHIRGRTPLHKIGEHRRRGLRDRATAAFEADLRDRLAVLAEADEDRHLVAAERVLALGMRVGVLKRAVTARVLVVIQDHLAVHLVELLTSLPPSPPQTPKVSFTLSNPAASRSISSGTVYR